MNRKSFFIGSLPAAVRSVGKHHVPVMERMVADAVGQQQERRIGDLVSASGIFIIDPAGSLIFPLCRAITSLVVSQIALGFQGLQIRRKTAGIVSGIHLQSNMDLFEIGVTGDSAGLLAG